MQMLSWAMSKTVTGKMNNRLLAESVELWWGSTASATLVKYYAKIVRF